MYIFNFLLGEVFQPSKYLLVSARIYRCSMIVFKVDKYIRPTNSHTV